ncbi:MAG: hypothetical protein L3J47_11295, partial [Sulfurovum sp.]|nr:hypothetical protein [Sulfurovum sp.]
LTYDLADVNRSSHSDIIRPRGQGLLPAASAVNTPSDLNITQNAINFRADMQGTLSMDLSFNFDRDMNLALNPRHIRFGDINVSLRNGPNVSVKRMTNYKPYGLKEHTQDVYFYYGRARSSKGFYEDVTQTTITTPISVVIYCDAMTLGIAECNNRGLNTQTDEYNWWKAVNHDTTNGDGDIALSLGTPTEGSGSAAINPTPIPIVTNGENNSVTITRSNNAGTTLPLTVPVDFVLQPNLSYTDRWLLYNEFNNSVPSPFYKVRFIGNEGWAGTGDTGHVVEHNASKRKNQRLGW